MLLYLDTCIVIYLVEEHHVYCPVIETALADTTADLCFSPLVELEWLVLPLKQNHTLLLDKYRRFFAVNKRLDIPHESISGSRSLACPPRVENARCTTYGDGITSWLRYPVDK